MTANRKRRVTPTCVLLRSAESICAILTIDNYRVMSLLLILVGGEAQ